MRAKLFELTEDCLLPICLFFDKIPGSSNVLQALPATVGALYFIRAISRTKTCQIASIPLSFRSY